MNIGLLTPSEVISSSLDFYDRKNLPYQSLEGFVRQIIGWREFVRGVYNTENLRGNFFDNRRKLTDKWYLGKTGIPPLDTVIKRVIENAYAHHIERLMVISNMMLLTEINPNEVYRWFMELFVDSSDWVMEPNVYGMGQFADGGTFATKPYISGSSYILKMSDFERGEWCDIWDGLYWRFVNKNRDFFLKNQRMSMMVRMFDKIDKDRKRKITNLAENFINDTTC
jgi:deoxyribodipyrimidine photolyase-related protein